MQERSAAADQGQPAAPRRGQVVSVALTLTLVAGVALALRGCGRAEDPWDRVSGGEPRVLTSFPPLYCFAKSVAGDEVAVLSLLTTVGPHDHKPDNKDALAVRKARVYFANGLTLDDSLTKLIDSAAGDSLKSVAVGNLGVPSDRRIRTGEIKHGNHTHPAGADPHVWLGIDEAVGMVNVIRDTLKDVDPKRADGYDRRAADYVGRLKKLHADGLALLKDSKNRNLVTNHESLAYFARSFRLNIVGHIQTQPGVSVDSKHLAELVDLCKKHEVSVIAVEPQYSRASADQLRDELRRRGLAVEVIEIDPVETAEPGDLDAGYYERVMRRNVETLAKHLK